jgi:hypothetical protein
MEDKIKGKAVNSELFMVETIELEKSVARDLKMPDPINIIAKDKQEVNENSTKYDRGSGCFHNIQDLFPSRK